MGDPVEKVMDVGKDVLESDIGKAALIGSAAYFGAPLLAEGAAMTEGAAWGAGLTAADVGLAGTLMPAAIPETAATLSGWGLTETAPGVFEAAKSGLSLTSALGTAKDVATVLAPVSSVAGSIEARKAAKAMASTPITPTTPTTMSSYPSPIVNKAMRGSIEQQVRRRGRASTILTNEGEKLGS